MKLASPYSVKKTPTSFPLLINTYLRTVEQELVVEERTGTNSCLPSIAVRGVCYLSGFYFHETVNSEYFYSLE